MHIKKDKNSVSVGCGGWVHLLFGTPTAMVGYHLHHSGFYAILDFLFWPVAWVKWLIFHEVNLSAIKDTFSWFLQ